jgi:hypothetical protein
VRDKRGSGSKGLSEQGLIACKIVVAGACEFAFEVLSDPMGGCASKTREEGGTARAVAFAIVSGGLPVAW